MRKPHFCDLSYILTTGRLRLPSLCPVQWFLSACLETESFCSKSAGMFSFEAVFHLLNKGSPLTEEILFRVMKHVYGATPEHEVRASCR